jgi:hypothetical protein
MTKMNYTLGADPEFFLFDGGFVPACGLFGGEKGKPIDLGDGYGLQEDNVMAEYNVPPADNPNDFARSVRHGLTRSLKYIRNHTKRPNLEVFYANFATLTAKQARMKGAKTFGCSPDFDAYLKGSQAPPVGADTIGNYRFAGGHVHFGYESDIPPFVVAAFADVFLGLPSLDWDRQHEIRRKTYGTAGRFRPTAYGIEYRVLSNSWVLDTHLCEHVALNSSCLMEFLLGRKEGEVKSIFKRMPWADVRACISLQDYQLHRDLLSYVTEEFGLRVHRA